MNIKQIDFSDFQIKKYWDTVVKIDIDGIWYDIWLNKDVNGWNIENIELDRSRNPDEFERDFDDKDLEIILNKILSDKQYSLKFEVN